MNYLSTLLQYLLFPGLLFAAVMGLITSWVDRKVTARVQMRVGPPFLQPFYDILKLMVKETIVPRGVSKWFFLSMPLLGLAATAAASTILWRSLIMPEKTFVGDLIVLIYLLTLPAVSVIMGSFASKNPLASLGGSREMKLLLSYELPFILSITVPIIHSHSIQMGQIILADASATRLSGIIAVIVAILCMQAKLTLVPFDIPEAETELAGGAFIEYSGPPFAMLKLTKAMMLFTMPVFLVACFCCGPQVHSPGGLVKGTVCILLFVVIITLIRNTCPRVRIDQAIRFFWGPVTIAALLSVILALTGW